MKRLVMLVGAAVLVAGGCGGDAGEPVVTLGDGGCVYDGPSEFDSGTLVTFRVVNESSESGGYAVLEFLVDATFEEFAQVVSAGPADAGPPPDTTVHTFRAEVDPGTEVEQAVGFTDSGTYGVVCFSDPDGSNRATAAAVLKVKP